MADLPVGNRFTRCPSNRHYLHPGLTCEQVGDREWNPITGYRTEAEAAANPPQFTGLLAVAVKET
jgi:hypothetical protein